MPSPRSPHYPSLAVSNPNSDKSLANQWPPLLRNTRSLPNSTSLEKIYKSALKEAGKLKSSIAPNLNLKRPHPQSLTIAENTTGTGHSETASTESWSDPKRLARNPRKSGIYNLQPLHTSNRFEFLAASQHSDCGFSQPSAQWQSNETVDLVPHASQERFRYMESTYTDKKDRADNRPTSTTIRPKQPTAADARLPPSQPPTSNASPRTNSVAQPSNTTQPPVVNNTRGARKAPPIHTSGSSLKNLIAILKPTVASSEFSIKESDPTNHSIYSNS